MAEGLVMKWKNPKFNSAGTIDCEIQVKAGTDWIPYTCDPNEPSPFFDNAKMFKKLSSKAEEFVEVQQTPDDLKKIFRFHIQSHVDAVAKSREYDSGTALAGYANSSVPEWKQEAEIFIAWRDAVWIQVFELLDDVKAGKKAIPANAEEIIEQLPEIDWDQSLEDQTGVE